ncbi:MAG: ImmA/IrrE family metallo-endopeptidase [Gammaproteobacteria bacterium]
MTKRDAILEGAQAAARLHEQLSTRKAVEVSGGCVDVFGALLSVDAALVFRPLEGLLGFCIRGSAALGVVISTRRPLRIQRYTGAHELGHVVLGHTLSLDGPEILRRGSARNEMEVAADSFASAFLLPKWLLQMHARRQGWNRASMAEPHVVYQLSLRAGASYEATCLALERHEIIDTATRQLLDNKPRRKIKAELLDGFKIENFYPDVWLLTERDEGLTLEGQPDDLFVLRLAEKGGAGYLWNTEGLIESGFAILRDTRKIPPPEKAIGAPVTRALMARRTEPARGDFSLELRRPWRKEDAPIASLHVTYDLNGKEVGLPRAVRRQLMAA